MDDVILVVHRLHQHRMSFVPIGHLVLGAYLRASRHPLARLGRVPPASHAPAS